MKISKFQIVLLAIFSIAIVVALIVIGLSRGHATANINYVTLWGTDTQDVFNSFLDRQFREDKTLSITYVQKSKATFDQELIEALANGTGPDVILLPETSILHYRNKISPIAYKEYPVRNFKDTFVQEGEMFLMPQGVLALPWSIDPLVMYWNRDLFANEGIANPPRFWDEFLTLPSALTKRDGAGNITQSATALGESLNIRNAKQILSALFLQLSNPIVTVSNNSVFTSTLANSSVSLDSALRFYTDFSNPAGPLYSWNLSLPPDKEDFLAGKLAVYFGFASELQDLRDKNPNLNFDVTYFPQLRGAGSRTTFASMEGLAVLKSSRNIGGAFSFINKLSGTDTARLWSTFSLLPPARRDLLSSKPADAFQAVFYDSSLWSRSWLDPNTTETNSIFGLLISGVTSGQLTVSESLKQGHEKLQNLLDAAR